MNRHGEKGVWTSLPILYQIALQNIPYMDFNLLVLTNFEVATMITMDVTISHLLGFLTK